MKLLEKVKQFMAAQKMTTPSSGPVVVGFSGGADSVTLLHILHNLGFTCIAAHCNFQLRGNDSQSDEAFARSFSDRLNLKTECIRFDTKSYARQHKLSIEMAARELRYNWFNQLQQHYGASSIAVGHHADDSIETALINLVRGTGIDGLSGIQPVNGSVIRPLLCLSQQEIEDYIQYNKLSYVTDSTNFSTEIIRNKIRLTLIPLAETINPSFRTTMVETMRHLGESADLLSDYLQQVKKSLVKSTQEEVRIPIEELRKHKASVTLLYNLLKDYNYNSRQSEQIFRALDAEAGKLFYSPTHCLLKDRTELIIRALRKYSSDIGGEVELRIFPRDDQFMFSTNPHLIHLDAGNIQLPLQLRTWKAGDSFIPLGMRNRKKLSDFLTDLKLNRMEKNEVKVLTDVAGSILWVVGFRIDEQFRVTSSTKTIAEIKLKKTIKL